MPKLACRDGLKRFIGYNIEEAAVRAYKKRAARIKKPETGDEVHEAAREFIGAINRLDGIETSERENVGGAVGQLMVFSPVGISHAGWEPWSNRERDF